jgi:hypothetical protein
MPRRPNLPHRSSVSAAATVRPPRVHAGSTAGDYRAVRGQRDLTQRSLSDSGDAPGTLQGRQSPRLNAGTDTDGRGVDTEERRDGY